MKGKIRLFNLKKKNLAINLYIIPSLFGFTIFYLLPFIAGLYYAFSDPTSGNFVGFTNFIDLLCNDAFLKAILNTVIFMSVCVPLNIILSLGFALLINTVTYKKNFFRMIFISPLVIPVASVAFFWQTIFDINGPINYFLHLLNIESIDWINSDYARVVVVIIYLWKNMGYNIVLYLASLNNIPKVYYEASSIDGANSIQQFLNITFIQLMPTTFFIFIISIINSFKTFREIYLISGEYPHESIYMIQHYINNMFVAVNYQKLTTAAYILALIITLLVWILFVFERKISSNLS